MSAADARDADASTAAAAGPAARPAIAAVPGLAEILDALREVIDPELGHNIVDLGLIYAIGVEENVLWLHLTMTTQGCPAQDYIRAGVRQRALRIPGIREVDVQLVWNPPWSVHKISPQIRAQLGIRPRPDR